MGLEEIFRDYGSSSGSNSSSLWSSREKLSSSSPQYKESELKQKSSSYLDLVMSRCTLEDVMREFRMNGSDSPYNPDEDRVWGPPSNQKIQEQLSGMGPPGAYLRQHSWPATTPKVLPKPRPKSDWIPRQEFTTSTPILNESPVPFSGPLPAAEITEEQTQVLKSLPNNVVYSILRAYRAEKKNKYFQECRFCKNNGERESYYRSHPLRARGAVACPVLRALTCERCGASGDRAHTAKYCPLATDHDRLKSMAMMRSMRMASGRRRHASAADEYVMFGDTPRSLDGDTRAYQQLNQPLDPLWAALEQKLAW